MMKFFKRNRKLGVAEGKGRYDLPLNQSAGTNFLILLVALMTFLALMSVTATLFLGDVTQRWSSGLENKLTVEIPALKSDGDIREAKDIEELSAAVAERLEKTPNVTEFEVLGEEDIMGLVSPWLGEDVTLDDLPLPGLISVHLQISNAEEVSKLEARLKNVSDDIRLDTHESWLGDILRLAGTLKLSAVIVTLIIALTTVTAIAGAIRSRMAEHKADIELLHLMGASDLYITKQLQRHAVVLTMKGSAAGALGGFVVLGLLWLIASSGESSVLPSMSLSVSQVIILLLLPLMASAIASQTARFTVLRVLGQMP
ncbi:MAG: FtsX-like permease family protein [Pseudomonadota bacterium]